MSIQDLYVINGVPLSWDPIKVPKQVLPPGYYMAKNKRGKVRRKRSRQ